LIRHCVLVIGMAETSPAAPVVVRFVADHDATF